MDADEIILNLETPDSQGKYKVRIYFDEVLMFSITTPNESVLTLEKFDEIREKLTIIARLYWGDEKLHYSPGE